LTGFGVAVGEALLDLSVVTGVGLETDFSGDIVDEAFVVLTPRTRSGETFRGVGLGGATDGCEVTPAGRLSGAPRLMALIHRLYCCAQSCMQTGYEPGADEARALH
jgi:hypothetical protein